jgi:multiple RNA-binding domain-containing protein 1
VIFETKNAFRKAGVNVESLEELVNGKVDGVKRSNHVLLAKNLPYGATENELAKMFGKFGSLDKIILPSTKTLALVFFPLLMFMMCLMYFLFWGVAVGTFDSLLSYRIA